MTDKANNVLSAYSEFDVLNLNTGKEKSVPTNLPRPAETVHGTETCHNNILIGPTMNVTNSLVNNLATRTNTESLIQVLNAQPWLVENSAASTLTYNLLSLVTTAHSLNTDGGFISSVMAETELHVTGPQWPLDIKPESLVT